MTDTQTPSIIRIKRALISVSDKTGLDDFAKALHSLGVELISTGGTARYIAGLGVPVKDVSDVTGFPEMMDGRVKTLHPLIHGGLLGLRDNETHQKSMKDHNITPIDLLVVNLYPFRETVARGADAETCIENIDIGGPAMIRSASKNHGFVTVVTEPEDYQLILDEMRALGGTGFETRRSLAGKAFAHTASYDSAISTWMAHQDDEIFPETMTIAMQKIDSLRYGENPHQVAALYRDISLNPVRVGALSAKQIQGKELSYNNINDTDAAFELVCEFDEPAVAIIKHANPCGVAVDIDCLKAYKRALSCDPTSAFGGIIALNRPLDAETATEIIKIFSEVIIAPAVDDAALPVLKTKPNVRVLVTGSLANPSDNRIQPRAVAGGYLLQTIDTGRVELDNLRVVTTRAPDSAQMRDMLFAFRVAKHVKSNAIVYAKNGMTYGIGAGQMSRIDSTRIAAHKMQEQFGAQTDLVVASDAFFPFSDGLLAAAAAGATAIIQPGGSIKDQEVIKDADEKGLAMVFTDMRHFKH